jgi:hypothetical protein
MSPDPGDKHQSIIVPIDIYGCISEHYKAIACNLRISEMLRISAVLKF